MSKTVNCFELGFPTRLRNREYGMVSSRRPESSTASASDTPNSKPPPDKVGSVRGPDDIPQDTPEPPDMVGVALSGGGIRSATFCLGVFQGLARVGLLGKIDYLSTVSGGGYFGSFLGALFAREEYGVGAGNRLKEVEEKLSDNFSHPVMWLRENGRYLSPTGSGDSLTAAAVFTRNWFAIHFILGLLLLTIFCGANFVRFGLDSWAGANSWLSWIPGGLINGPLEVTAMWWSPLIWLPAVVLVVWVLPVAWAYWLTQDALTFWRSSMPWWGTLLLILAALSVVFAGGIGVQVAAWIIVIGALAAAILVAALRCCGGPKPRNDGNAPQNATIQSALDSRGTGLVAFMRNKLSRWLTGGFLLVAVLTMFALVDSLGQTVYSLLPHGEVNTLEILIAALGLGGTVGLIKRFAVLIDPGQTTKKKGFALPKALLLTLLGVALALILSVTWCMAAHAIVWGGGVPTNDPGACIIMNVDPPPSRVELDEDHRIVVGDPRQAPALTTAKPNVGVAGWAFLVGLVLIVVFGQAMRFINLSSHQQLYAARLARAYLGASNTARAKAENQRVTELIEGDDLKMTGYRPHDSGGPLHILNVTINETVSGRSQLEQRDRKGLPMAVGPCGLSVGLRSHALWSRTDEAKRRYAAIEPLPLPGPPGFHVLAKAAASDSKPNVGWVEALSLGHWVAISGAAFSTGIGARTSLGLSLLLGLANVRLGYWWDSDINPEDRDPKNKRSGVHIRAQLSPQQWISLFLSKVLPVYSHLLEEMLARFHGPARRRWYLSDGGHFENTGCYELLRRRLPFIICCDDGADPDYFFQDIANLVRKARLDFDAEVLFFTQEEIENVVAEELIDYVGTLQDLVRHEQQGDGNDREVRQIGRSYSRRHATLARVRYLDNMKPDSVILFIKPTLTGDEPADVLQYHGDHQAFPQEPTADQFFDEAQWESYRKLGEHIATTLFAGSATEPVGKTKWRPCQMTAPGARRRASRSRSRTVAARDEIRE